MDQEQLDREIARLAADPALRLLLDQIDGQIIADWMASDAGASVRREQLWHELAGVLRLRVRLKKAEDDELIRTTRLAAREAVEAEQDQSELTG